MIDATESCPPEDYLRRFLRRSLAQPYRDRVTKHLQHCSFCARTFGTLVTMRSDETMEHRVAARLVLDRLQLTLRRRASQRPAAVEDPNAAPSPRAVAAHLRTQGLRCDGWLDAEGPVGHRRSHLGSVAVATHDAIDELHDALLMAPRRTPDSSDPHYALAVFYLFNGAAGGPDQAELQRAHVHLDRAERLGLDPAIAHNEHGVIHLTQGHDVDAAERFLEACRLAPGMLVAHANLALSLTRLELSALAQRAYCDASALARDDEARATIAFHAQEADAAVQSLLRSIPDFEARLDAASPMELVRLGTERPDVAHCWLTRRAMTLAGAEQAAALRPLATHLGSKVAGGYFPLAVVLHVTAQDSDTDSEAAGRASRLLRAYGGGELQPLTQQVRSDLHELVELTRELHDPRHVAARAILAATLYRDREYAEAAATWRALAEDAALAGLPEIEAGALQSLARIQKEEGDFSDAVLALVERAIELQQAPVYTLGRAQALRVTSEVLARCSDLDRAQASASQAAELLRRVDPRALAPVYIDIAELYRERRRQVADLYYRQARATAALFGDEGQLPPHFVVGRIELEQLRPWPDLTRLDALRGELADPAKRSLPVPEVYRLVRDLASRLDDLDTLEPWAQHELVQVLANTLPRLEAELDYDIKARLYALEARYLRHVGPELARYLPHDSAEAAIDAALVEMERAEATLSDAVAAQRFIGERQGIYATAMELAMQAEPTRATSERLVLLSERARARLCVRGPDSTRPSAATDAHEWLLSVRDRLGPENQIVSFYFLDRQLVAWIVDGARLEVVRTGLPESQVRALVTRLHEPLHRRSELDYGALTDLAAELMPALVDAGLRVARRGARPRLVVIPHGWLHDLPFELLPIGEDRMLLDAADVAYSPSISAWLAGQAAAEAQLPPTRVLHVANPVTTRPPDRGLPAISSADAVHALLEGLNPGSVHTLQRQQATPTAVLDEAEHADLIHFTAHARHLGTRGTGTGIILSPGGPAGLLQADAIARRRLRGAPLVVLPVCEGARPSWRSGESGIGLPWAWLSAGARGVVAPIAQVEEAETLELIREFYARLPEDGAVRALGAARRACRDRSPARGAWPALRYYE